VDLVHRSIVERAKGLHHDLICVVNHRSDGGGEPHATERRQRDAHGGTGGKAHRCSLDFKLPAMDRSMDKLYVELRTRRTRLGHQGGGSGGHGGLPRKGAVAAIPMRRCGRGGAVCAKQMGG
jgi:hypothetical protein